MTPSARVQAAIEILDLVIAAARGNGAAADAIVADWFRTRRFAGSGDRRAVRDLVYRAVRSFGDAPVSGRAAMVGLARDDAGLHACFDGSTYGPAPILADEEGALPSAMPQWLQALIPAGEHAALLNRAPFDLRVNTLKGTREQVLAMLPDAEPLAEPDTAIRLPDAIPLAARPELSGLVEVQDAGSQIIAACCAAKPGQTIVDLCAGAGGKTLAIAAGMTGEGSLIACDTDRNRLSKLRPRAQVAGAAFIESRLLDAGRERTALTDLDGQADCVLVDAPCSGTGTWRRNPELRWRLTPERLDAVVALQAHVLALASPLVRPGGALVYAVCSLIEREGLGRVEAFLAAQSGWALAEHRLLTPSRDATDGFFVARLVRAC